MLLPRAERHQWHAVGVEGQTDRERERVTRATVLSRASLLSNVDFRPTATRSSLRWIPSPSPDFAAHSNRLLRNSLINLPMKYILTFQRSTRCRALVTTMRKRKSTWSNSLPIERIFNFFFSSAKYVRSNAERMYEFFVCIHVWLRDG